MGGEGETDTEQRKKAHENKNGSNFLNFYFRFFDVVFCWPFFSFFTNLEHFKLLSLVSPLHIYLCVLLDNI